MNVFNRLIQFVDRTLQFGNLGTLIMLLLPVAGLAGIGLPLLLDQNNLAILSVYLVVPMIFSAFFYWVYCRDV